MDEVFLGFLGVLDIGRELGDDLHQRDTRAVVIDPGASGREVHEFAGVFFQVHPADADVFRAAVFSGDGEDAVITDGVGVAVLADLESFRQVGVEVVFAVEHGVRGDGASQSERGFDDQHDRFFVRDGEGAGHSEADRAGPGVGLTAEGDFAPTEHFALGFQFSVDFESDADGIAGRLGHSWAVVYSGGVWRTDSR